MNSGNNQTKRMALIASQGTLDWAYPPFILASTAAAMEIETSIFFTFYGLGLLLKDLKMKVAPQANPAMPFKYQTSSEKISDINWPVPNLIKSALPGFETLATRMMKKTFQKNGVATIEELREACVESGVRMIACQMTMDVFGFSKQDFIEGIEVGGAATFLEFAADSDIQLFI
jgi:peroxiredoxin family protein